MRQFQMLWIMLKRSPSNPWGKNLFCRVGNSSLIPVEHAQAWNRWALMNKLVMCNSLILATMNSRPPGQKNLQTKQRRNATYFSLRKRTAASAATHAGKHVRCATALNVLWTISCPAGAKAWSHLGGLRRGILSAPSIKQVVVLNAVHVNARARWISR